MSRSWKIGEIADRSGLSVRTLHHYDQIGLLSPRGRTSAGHRLYTNEDIQRLHHILALRQLGFPLADIGCFLDDRAIVPHELVALQLNRLREKHQLLAQQIETLETLEALQHASSRSAAESVDLWFDLIKVMNMIESYYSPQQLETLKSRRHLLGKTGMEEAERQWRHLFDALTKLLDQGVNPSSEAALTLAIQWRSLIEAFTGGNPDIQQSLGKIHSENPKLLESFGFKVDPRIFPFIQESFKVLDTKSS